VYYIDAQQGMWYAVNTNGVSYRVFYFDSNGNTVFVTAYWWDANTSYMIFQAPISGRLYLRQEQYTLSVLDTKSWFELTQSDFPQPQPQTGTAELEFFYGSSVWSVGSTDWSEVITQLTFSGYTIDSISYSPDIGVVVTATATWMWLQRGA
jgi:hypothetical protein